jgi:uncharacterized phage protein (TIGR02218 family)
MRTLSDGFRAALADPITQLCQCVQVTSRNGLVFRATNHDRDLEWQGAIYPARGGLEVQGLHLNAGLEPDTAVLLGPLGDVSREALQQGVWDRAKVEVFWVDWSSALSDAAQWSPSGMTTIAREGHNVLTGYISNIKYTGFGFEADLASIKAKLTRQIGRVYARHCDAVLGDARCGVALNAAAYSRQVPVTGLLGQSAVEGVVIDALDLDPEAFRDGVLLWLSGPNAGARTALSAVAVGETGWHLFWRDAPLSLPQTGDDARLVMGCDRRFETCQTRFANAENFRGFPHMPGSDALLVGPEADTPKDGGRR